MDWLAAGAGAGVSGGGSSSSSAGGGGGRRSSGQAVGSSGSCGGGGGRRSSGHAVGLANNTGEYNCFLNCVVQALFACEGFRARLLADGDRHSCVGGGPQGECVTCAMLGLFRALSASGTNPAAAPFAPSSSAADPTALRRALEAAFRGTELFRLSEKNDASETVQEIYNCLHGEMASGLPGDMQFCAGAAALAEGGGAAVAAAGAGLILGAGGGQSKASRRRLKERARAGKFEAEVSGASVILDTLGLDVTQSLRCHGCKKTTRKHRYTEFLHLTSVTPLLEKRNGAAPGDSLAAQFGRHLRAVDASDTRSCDRDAGGCGLEQPLRKHLRCVPPLFTVALGWESGCARAEEISGILGIIEPELRVRGGPCTHRNPLQACPLLLLPTRTAQLSLWKPPSWKRTIGLHPSSLWLSLSRPLLSYRVLSSLVAVCPCPVSVAGGGHLSGRGAHLLGAPPAPPLQHGARGGHNPPADTTPADAPSVVLCFLWRQAPCVYVCQEAAAAPNGHPIKTTSIFLHPQVAYYAEHYATFVFRRATQTCASPKAS